MLTKRKLLFIIIFISCFFYINIFLGANDIKFMKNELLFLDNSLQKGYELAYDEVNKKKSDSYLVKIVFWYRPNIGIDTVIFYFNSNIIPSIYKFFGNEVYDMIITVNIKKMKITKKNMFYSNYKGQMNKLYLEVNKLSKPSIILQEALKDEGINYFLDQFKNIDLTISIENFQETIVSWYLYFRYNYYDNNSFIEYRLNINNDDFSIINKWCTDEKIREKFGIK